MTVNNKRKKQTYEQPSVYSLTLLLPKAAVTLIAKRTTISRPTIYKFFKGFAIRPYEKERILVAIVAIEKENKQYHIHIKHADSERD